MREVDAAQSRIEDVTVFARGARVRRVLSVAAPLPAALRLTGLPLTLLDDTVRAEIQGPAVVTMVRTGLAIAGGEVRDEEPAELAASRRRVAVADAEVERLAGALARLADVPIVEDDPSDEPPAPWQAVVAARRSLVALRAERELALREQLARARHEQADACRALEVALEHDRQAGTARAARLHEERKHVDVELAAAPGAGDIVVHLEYQVAAARWAPSYVARLGEGGDARFELRAVVAQDSGEDWTGVALQLSTAEPARFAPLPELHPQKIGRRQAEPARRGFRAPPTGADALFGDYDRQFPRQVEPITSDAVFDDSTYEGKFPPPPTPSGMLFGGLADEVWDEESSRAKKPYPTEVLAMPAPASARSSSGIASAVADAVAAPFALVAQAARRSGAPGPRRERELVVAAPQPRLDYGNLRMAPPSSADRGRLVPAPSSRDRRIDDRVATTVEALDRLALPPGHVDDWVHTYDYAFASDAKVDVAADGTWHSIALTTRSGAVAIRHVAVPREQPDVFRVAAIANPFDGPLLPGPIDIYDRGQFLVTSDVDYTPPGGTVDVGLGVDASVKIARNVEFHEEAAGMLRGALRLVHAVSIDVDNLSPRAIELEVRERVPVTREGDDDIEVTVGKVDPGWERWTPDAEAPRDARLRGGYRWKLAVPARTKKLLRAGYEIKIAGKHELVGGNRREP